MSSSGGTACWFCGSGAGALLPKFCAMAMIFPIISGFPRIHDFETIPARFVRKAAEGFVADDFGDEVCMALEIQGGLAVLVGCSHPGILNMMTQVSTLLGKPIRAVFGGTHLLEAEGSRMEKTLEDLHRAGVKRLAFSHCSGEAAAALAAEDRRFFCYTLHCGDTLEI